MIARLYEPTPEAYQLEEILLAYGGTDLVWVGDPDCELILEKGELLPAATVAGLQMDPGQMSKCHTNSAYWVAHQLDLWVEEEYAAADQQSDVQIWTGYVMETKPESDGKQRWRSHSWVMNHGRLIETTLARGAYFGCPVPDMAERMQYALENYDDPYDPDEDYPDDEED